MNEVTDYSIRLQEITKQAPTLNQGLQLLLVIDGEITVETDSRYYHLLEKDLLVINRNQLYGIIGKKGNRVLVLLISDEYMKQFYDDYLNSRFECFSKEVDRGRQQFVKKIKRAMVEMLLSYYKKEDSYKIELQSYTSEVLLNLIRRFKQKASSQEKIDTNIDRIKQLITYLEQNYHQPISLESTAKQFYLSSGYLSRYFKQKMGVGFNRYLMEIRMKHAMKELLYTSNTIEKIAMNNGFANAKSFTRLFKEMFNETPTCYREKHQETRIKKGVHAATDDMLQLEDSRKVLLKLRGILNDEVDTSSDQTEWCSEDLLIDAGVSPTKTVIHPKQNLLIGELNELHKSGVRDQLLMIKKDLGLDYIGISRLIHGTTMLPPIETDERIASTSPYYNADYALNFLRVHGLSLFVIVDYQEITEDEAHYFSELEQFLKHCLNMYGPLFVGKWRFLLYEPYGTAVSKSEMQRVYIKLYKRVKQLVPDLEIGLFIPYSFKQNKISPHHQWIFEQDIPMDFIGFEVDHNEVIDFEELGDERFALAADYIEEKVARFKAFIRSEQKEKPIHLISWNTLTGRTRYTSGMFFRGALIFKHAFEISSEVESVSFWINTEQHEKAEANKGIRLEGMEFFHYFNGKRPAYFAMQFLKRLNGTIIAHGEGYIMTKSDTGYHLVLFNYNHINPYYSIEDMYMRKLNKDIHVTLKNLERGKYQIRKFVFDKDHGALYKKWWELNSEYGMDQEVIRYIIETSQPSLELFDKMFEEEWSFYSYLTYNAIHFYDIRKCY